MRSKELKRLSRNDLLEMMLALSKENEELRETVALLKRQLEDRTITIDAAGSLAEAALQLNGVFEAAQAACEQYTQNIHDRSAHLEATCRRREQETQEICDRMLAQAKAQAQAYLAQAKANAYLPENENPEDYTP